MNLVPSPEAEELLENLRGKLAERVETDDDPKRIYEQAMSEFPAPESAGLESVELGGYHWLRVVASGADEKPGILYLHGGGFGVGSADSNQDLLARLGHAAETTVVGIDYPLLPEGSFPAPLETALAAYRELASDDGGPVLAGSSAGGGLALTTAMSLRDEGEPPPPALLLLSPWVDLTVSAPSLEAVSDGDWLGRETLVMAAEQYLGGREPTDPLASPLHGDLSNLPPMLIQVGGSEILLDDARRLADSARHSGTRADLDVWPGMFHNFQLFGSRLEEADAALTSAGKWVAERLRQA